MALSAKPRLNKSRGREVAKIDICKFDTNRLRAMTRTQLTRTSESIGRLHEIPKRDKTRRLLSSFLFNMRGYRETSPYDDPDAAALYERKYKIKYVPNAKVRENYRREAERVEREI